MTIRDYSHARGAMDYEARSPVNYLLLQPDPQLALIDWILDEANNDSTFGWFDI